MKVAVFGAGAVGSYYGGMLARAAHDVVLIARKSHSDAIRQRGLRLQTGAFDETVHPESSEDASSIKGADLVLLCVKCTDTEQAALQIKPHLGDGTVILCLQNGVDNADRVRSLLPGAVVGSALVYAATELVGPGHVRLHGGGELLLEAIPAAEDLGALLRRADIAAKVSADVKRELWRKLILNCVYNATSALTRQPYGVLASSQEFDASLEQLLGECLAVAAKEGVAIGREMFEDAMRVAQVMPTQSSSMAQDVARGRPTEIDHLNGFVLRRGRALDVPMPANQLLCMLVERLQHGRLGEDLR